MLNDLIHIARGAGQFILEEYRKTDIVADHKADDSPLTLADQRAHDFIAKALHHHYPDILLLSEEGRAMPYAERQAWTRFFCVDPMDGTKEFIKKSGQFTVNIALVEAGRPLIGVVYAPAIDWCYYTDGTRAWKQVQQDPPQHITVRQRPAGDLHVVASKDHAGPKVQQLIERLKNVQLKSMGSSLKFCLIAEGEADAYLRDVPTYEWDTAAAQAIVTAAGGQVLTLDGEVLTYNKENILNPALITIGDDIEFWMKAIV